MTTPPKLPSRLVDRWVFWHDRWEVKDGETVQSLLDVGEADTARGFWQIFNSNQVEQLAENSSLQVFKGQVKPEWEDPSNINGGHFRLTALPNVPAASVASRLWYNVIAAAIGNQFTLATSIVGVGYTNKGPRKIISVWINSTDAAIVRSLQAELNELTGDKFTTKFVAHKELPRSDFMAQQAVWHRRTKSAPSQYVNLEFDEDDLSVAAGTAGLSQSGTTSGTSGNHPGQHGHAGVASHAAGANHQHLALSGSQPEVMKLRRNAPLPLETFVSPDGSTSLHDVLEHMRSKSEGVGRDVVPMVPSLQVSSASVVTTHTASTTKLSRQSTSPAPPLAHGERTDTEFSWTDAQQNELKDSNSGVYPMVKAPTPMKVWADNWSPSQLNAALQNRPPFMEQGHSVTTSPGAAQAEAASAHQQALLENINTPSTGTNTHDSPMNLSSTQTQSTMTSALNNGGGRGNGPRPAGSSPGISVGQHLVVPANAMGPPPQGYPVVGYATQHPTGMAGYHHHQQHHHHQHSGYAPMVPAAIIHNPYNMGPGGPPLPFMAGMAYSPQHHHHYHQHQTQQHHHHHHAPHHMPAPHLPASALPGAQPLPYVIVRQPVSHHVPQSDQNKPRGRPAADRPPQRGAQPNGGNGRGLGSPGVAPGNDSFGRNSNRGGAATGGAAGPEGEDSHSRAQHTKSDSCGFMFKGWKFPSGLNRKERRRIVFSNEVLPGDYPGAVFVGEHIPDGPIDENGNPMSSSND